MSYVSSSSNRIFSFLFLVIMLVTLSITACRKEEGPGSIGGSIHPYNGAISFSLNDPVTGEERYTTLPSANGEFVFTDLEAGEYILRIKTTPLYHAPEGVRVTAAGYKHAEVPMIYLAYNDKAQAGTMDFTVDGQQHHLGPEDLKLTNFLWLFSLHGTYYAGPSKYSMYVHLNDMNKTGTYSPEDGYQLSLLEFAADGHFVKSWITRDDSTASAVITMYDPESRLVSGTFNGIMSPEDSIGPVRKVSGEFTNVLY